MVTSEDLPQASGRVVDLGLVEQTLYPSSLLINRFGFALARSFCYFDGKWLGDAIVGCTYDERELTVATARIKRTAACP